MRPAVALLLLLVVPASAPAATGERADARAFIEATKRLRASLPPGRPSVSGELVRLYRDSPCTPALEQVPAGRASEELFEATVLYSVAIVMHPLRDELAAFATDLDRIRVRSRVLRSGRAAMRRNIRVVRRIPEPPADFCECAETWRRAGFPPGGAPPARVACCAATAPAAGSRGCGRATSTTSWSDTPRVALTDDIRAACADVAAEARHVRIVHEAIEPYAATLPAQSPPAPDLPPGEPDERRAAFQLTLNAVNFGSGWFPTLRKTPGMSGFRTVEAGLRARGPWTAGELAGIGRDEVAHALGQDPEHELMGLFETALRELGAKVRDGHGGSFLALARSAGTVEGLATELASWPTWFDVSPYGGREVPFFKRAQIAAADLTLAGLAPGADLHRLTLFADNLVPHVLRLDGVLGFDDALVARIDAGELIEHDAPEEVEIRACALHAVELLVAAHPEPTTPTALDNQLWHRGGGARYKARPRHRARTTAY